MKSATDSGTAAPKFQPSFSLTRFTSRSPARLSKAFTLEGGALICEGGGNMTAGIAERLTLTLAEFAALLPTLKPSQATCYGVAAAGYDTTRIVVADKVTPSGNGDTPIIARTRDFFTWPDGAGILMLDYDAPKDDAPLLDCQQLRVALAIACPALATAPAVWRPSASSCIHVKSGAELRGISGQRIYLPVIDASDIERAAKVLFDRLWLAGYGRYELSNSGAWLARGPIDASVFQPERLDFCGGAVMGAGLEQRLPTPVIFNSDAPYLDTRAALPDLDTAEQARLAELREAAKTPELVAEQAGIKEAWIGKRVDQRLATMPEPKRAAARPKLTATYRQAVEGGRLAPDFELTVKAKGGKVAKRITVADALADKAAWHEATCLDPLEPDYPDGAGRFVGWLNLVHKPPYISSRAHGGIRYELTEPAATESVPGSPWSAVEDEPPDMPEWFANGPNKPFTDAPDTPDKAAAFTKHHPMLMRKSGTSELLKNLFNAVAIAENALPGLIGYNEFRQRIEKRINPPWGGGPGQWTEGDTIELACCLAKPFTSFGLDLLGAAITGAANHHKFNPGQDRLRALAEQWDGMNRIDSWLVDYLNAKVNSSNSDYLREIGACWIKGVAARVLKPGCKRDDVLVLRGDQGWRKSTAARIIADAIAPDAFTDCLGDLGSKDARGGIRGVVIAELGELASLNKSDVESVKAFVAAPSDRFREAYGRGERDYPRTVSFIGTTNHPTFLQDPTGNRRWWPVSMSGPIDTDLLTDAMPQILGEAAHRVLKGEAWHVTHTAALAQAEGVRAAHFEDDVWTAPALAAADRLGGDYITIAEILNTMGIRLEQQTRPAQTRIGAILRTNGWLDTRRRVNGRRTYVWERVPLAKKGDSKGDSPEASQTAACPPVPLCPPYQHNLVKNAVEKAGDTTPTPTPTPEAAAVAPAISTLCRKEGGQGGQGGQTRQTLAETPAPLPVPLISKGDTAPPSTPVEMPPMSGDAARLADVLKLFRGAETDKRLARKMGWSVSRLAGAAGVLATAGLAEVHGEMIKPAGRLVAAV